MLQRKINTAPNRYPGIFRTVRSRVSKSHGPNLGGGRLKILSFGCSMGIEVLSLRAYFPDATIFGCDRDPIALQAALKNTRDDACRLFLSTPEAVQANGPYDVIFAMSVFCQYPASKKVDNLNALYPFDLYQKLAGNLMENLREGGLYCVINSNYLFSDLPMAGGFDFLRSPLIAGNGFIDKFGRDGRRLTTSFGNKYGYSHRKESEGITDTDLRDCIYLKSPAGEKGGRILFEEDFLLREQPADLKLIRSLPDAGESLERAIAERRVAMARKSELYVGSSADDRWVRHEWFKTRFDGSLERFGGWWVPVSSELAGDLSAAQQTQPEELTRYIKKSKSITSRVKRLLGAD